MAWTEITRPKYQRDGLRYASDTTDEEWALTEPHIPPPASCGRTRETSMREVINAIFYIHCPDRLPVAPAAQKSPAIPPPGPPSWAVTKIRDELWLAAAMKWWSTLPPTLHSNMPRLARSAVGLAGTTGHKECRGKIAY